MIFISRGRACSRWKTPPAEKFCRWSILSRAHELARARNLGFHLDGARAFNAAVALGVQLSEITARFDSVSICLSKGLGAPVGSVLCARRELISRARRWRKMTGGGMRQVGVLAAAGLFALEHNIARLADDHARAQQLAEKLMQIDELEVRGAHTNMVFITLRDGDYDAFREHARKMDCVSASASRRAWRDWSCIKE